MECSQNAPHDAICGIEGRYRGEEGVKGAEEEKNNHLLGLERMPLLKKGGLASGNLDIGVHVQGS